MKTKFIAITLSLAAAGAYAQTGYDNMLRQRTGPTQVAPTSALSRDAVRTDLLAAIARGERFPNAQAIRTGPTKVRTTSMLEREEVREELFEAIESGEYYSDLLTNRTGPTEVDGSLS